MRVITVTIRELPRPRGWLHKETGRVYKTAAGAQKAVERDGKRIAVGGRSVAHLVTWEPITPFGTAVVKALGP